jgi:histone H3/H4
VKSALSKLDNCVGQLEGLVESCEGPAVMALSMIPNVGSVVGFVCAQASSMVGNFRLVSDRINNGFSIVSSVSHAVSMDEVESRHVRLTQLKEKDKDKGISIKNIGNAVKKVADKVEEKIPDKIKDVATDVANKAANVASDVASKTVDVAKDAGDALKSLGNPIDIILNKVFGCPSRLISHSPLPS